MKDINSGKQYMSDSYKESGGSEDLEKPNKRSKPPP